MVGNLNTFFNEKLIELKCGDITRAYIVSIFSKYANQEFDYSNKSLTLVFAEAKHNFNFIKFQNLGDWLFWLETIHPKFLEANGKSYYHTLAQMSYYNCYKIINKKLKVYEVLADEFSDLTAKTKTLIRNI